MSPTNDRGAARKRALAKLAGAEEAPDEAG